LAALTTSILGATLSPPPCAPSLSRFSSTENYRGRGRQLTKSPVQSNSKSRSPSLAPMTPTDPTDSTRPFEYDMKSKTTSGELSSDSGDYGRGRMRGVRRVSPHVRLPSNVAELADIEEQSRWAVPSSTPDYPWTDELDSQDASVAGKPRGTRAGSVPPQHINFSTLHETSWSRANPVWIPRPVGTRSKSVGFEPERPIPRFEY